MKARTYEPTELADALEGADEPDDEGEVGSGTHLPRIDAPAVTVQRTYLRAGKALETEATVEALEVSLFMTHPARVGAGFARTVNLGNYESARIEISLEMPCYVEEIGETTDHVVAFIQERLQKETADVVVWAKKQGVKHIF